MAILAFPSVAILDSTAAGRSLLTAADATAQRSLLGLGTLATQNGNIADYLTTASAVANFQPLDSDLTAIAALATTSFGRSVLTQADAAAVRTLIGAGTSSFNGAYSSLTGIPATFAPSAHNHSGSEITSGTVDPARLGTGTSITTKFLRGDSTWQTISGGGDALTTNTLAQFAATTSSQLAGVISDETGSGSLVFATSPTLVTPVLGTPTSGNLSNCTGYSYASLTGIPTTLAGYGITDAQPLDSDLTAIAALTTTTYGLSLLTQADAPTARTTLGLGTGDSPTFSNATATNRFFAGNGTTTVPSISFANFTGTGFSSTATSILDFAVGGNHVARLSNAGNFAVLGTGSIGFANGAADNTADTLLFRDAANILAQRNGVNAQAFRLYNTFTDSSNYERGKFAWSGNVLQIGTEKAGTGAARALELQTDGTTRFQISATTPEATLISSNINTTAGLTFLNNGTGNFTFRNYLLRNPSIRLYWSYNGTDIMYLDGSGNLVLNGGITFGGDLAMGTRLISGSNGSSLRLYDGLDGHTKITASTFDSALSTIRFFTGASSVERMRIAHTGDIGIGVTTTPTERFQVSGGKTLLAASTTSKASLNIPSGSDPTSPADYDIWSISNLLKVRLNGRTQTLSYQITSGTAAPTGGSDGDIYLQYT